MPAYNTSLIKTAVNNATLDPLSGFDCDVYVFDQGSGNQVMVGRFTSFQFTVRNATEPYMEFGQRIPRLLDGEYQFGWVLERGLIDVRVFEQTFGHSVMGRESGLSRSPRLMIAVDLDAEELQDADGRTNATATAPIVGGPRLIGTNARTTTTTARRARGRYYLRFAKVDSLTVGAMAGRSVIATRWEGLCEGIYYQNIDENNVVEPDYFIPAGDSRAGLIQSPLAASLPNQR